MKQKRKNRRWRLIADVRLQGQLCLRIGIYWLVCQLTMVGTIAAFNFLSGGDGSAVQFLIPALIVSSLFLPIAMFEILRFSNRFVGPVVNLRRRLDDLATTGTTEEAKVRVGDFYSEICGSINAINLRLQEHENESKNDFGANNTESKRLETVV